MNKVHLDLGGGKLYQFSGKNGRQMMSYLIETPDGRLIMIDGGQYCDEDADFLEGFLINKGGRISAWFITHAHDDHFGALLRLLERGKLNIQIDRLCFSFPPIEWVGRTEPTEEKPLRDFLELIKAHSLNVSAIGAGDLFDFGVVIEVINSLGDSDRFRSINDTSIVLRAHFPKRDVLFLGDLAENGQKFLINDSADKLSCDIVQMAHHGQWGVDFNMYKLIMPKICLWPTPDWLWDNDNGEGYGTGPWRTLETRAWMEQLGVQASFPAAYGDYEFD